MAKKVVEVRECDRCGKEPAHTWVITGPEGAVREIELCDRHSEPVANAYALGRSVVRRPAERGSRRGPARSSEPSVESPAGSPAAAVLPPVHIEAEPVWR